ncbi:MAG: two-partner secretion domain-containing protein [Thainema sp.]
MNASSGLLSFYFGQGTKGIPCSALISLALFSTVVCPAQAAASRQLDDQLSQYQLSQEVRSHFPSRPIPQTTQVAQAIIAAPDGAGTVVNQAGQTFTITGGTQAGANLFHSFERLGLDAGQIANILTNDSIDNVLGRVVGGDPSVINGILQITGGDSNLFLMNPAGIIFGADAYIDVPGALTATTANAIQIGDEWFNAIGSNSYANLVGAPNAFAFNRSEPGAVINAGSLNAAAGESVTLLGGTVINTGTVSTPGGLITIAAVPGENLVRITQDGSLLSLELPTDGQMNLEASAEAVRHSDIPALLSGGTVPQNLGLVVEDGVIKLASTGTAIPTDMGTTIVSGSLHVADTATGATGGSIDVVGDRVGLINASINAAGANDGGVVRIGGDYQGEGTIPNSDRTFIDSNTTITADALNRGDGGRVIVWADEATQFSGEITARGGSETGNGGFVEVSGKDRLAFAGFIDTSAANGVAGTLLLDPENILIANAPSSAGINAALPDILAGEFAGDITINAAVLESQLGTILLEATNDIQIANGISLTFASSSGSITFTADSDTNGAGSFSMDPSQTITTDGRDLIISGTEIQVGDILTDGEAAVQLTATGDINTGRINDDTGGFPQHGPVTISSGGSVTARNEGVRAAIRGESIEITAANSITTGDLSTQDIGGIMDPLISFVRLTAETGNIRVGYVLAGLGGIDIDAAGVFQALNARESYINRTSVPPAELAQYINSLGYTEFPNQIFIDNFLVSIEAVDGPIAIRYGQNRETLFNESNILIEGDPNQQFVIGPNYDSTTPFLPGVGSNFDPYDAATNLSGYFPPGASSTFDVIANATPLAFPSTDFPSSASGMVAGIASSATDASLAGSLQSQLFGNPDTGGGNGGNGGGGTGGNGNSGGGRGGTGNNGGTGGNGGGGTDGGGGNGGGPVVVNPDEVPQDTQTLELEAINDLCEENSSDDVVAVGDLLTIDESLVATGVRSSEEDALVDPCRNLERSNPEGDSSAPTLDHTGTPESRTQELDSLNPESPDIEPLPASDQGQSLADESPDIEPLPVIGQGQPFANESPDIEPLPVIGQGQPFAEAVVQNAIAPPEQLPPIMVVETRSAD